jgi:hypothetical protein
VVPERTRRPLDTFALTCGLLALAVSGLALVARADLFEVDGLVLLATVWLVVGIVGVTRGVLRLMERDRTP